ncbi:MAG TPA: glycoside hydrolase family 3 C-terminal domain-containing protein [Candidatus Eisenbergiella merdavium]|uniref:Glycoside hydrolase family 3 C-terminal domain-containing protein n=1 Tax=Candidatus Eisenbergiella merdavium TaxID=2838551 RepID=A0A9D2NJF5_9FIRM|nr:glycoside hydrolase family 3 C-terminal domain-containing protein [Candidatus Eisenbergiella merdavium]
MEEKIYGYFDEKETAAELANRELARWAAEESIVLLKNDGALPLASGKIALYGMGARRTVKGGLGSGSVEERYSVTIEEGLKNAGYEITSQLWLDDYDKEYEETYQAYVSMVEEEIKGMTNPMEIIPKAHSYVYRYPSGRAITDEDIRKSDTDTCIYVLTRQAGEGNDRRLEPGDYLLTDTEREHLKKVGSAYRHTIVIINVGGGMDLSFAEEIPGINAVVYFVQGGEEGGNALAELISGKVNFSGKLASTLMRDYQDVPFGDGFSYLNGDPDNEEYHEGIYVGYRYYDSFQKEVRYPFGYGLSYTSFALECREAALDTDRIRLAVRVTNTGRQYAGKEVVQAYVSAPQGKLAKEYQSLAGFAKTGTLAPGESEEAEISIDVRQMASYDEERAAWVLERGDYIIRTGNSSRNTSPAAVVRVKQDIITMQCANKCTPTDVLEDFVPENVRADCAEDLRDIPILLLDAESVPVEQADYSEPQFIETEEERVILDRLGPDKWVEFLRGGDLQRPPEGALEISGAGGKTTTALLQDGIRNVVMSDGPAGINIANKVKYMGDGRFAVAVIPERYNWGMMRAYAARMIPEGGRIVYRYATAWPVEMLLAQSWNLKLLEEIGRAAAREMETFGITLWLAPGMNIHRNPLGGRNFEYYSEDPFLSGKCAAAVTRGVQETEGLCTVVKHFACNDAEDNRNHSSSNVSERALREIHLRGFEYAVKEAQPHGLMSSYNRINHVYAPNSHDLLTDILRCEWGYQGLVMTDWGSCNASAADAVKCAPAGNDIVMPGSAEEAEAIRKAMHEGLISQECIRRSAARVLRVMLMAKTEVIL